MEAIEDGEAVKVGPGRVWHNFPDRRHHVKNLGSGRAEIVMLIGV